MDAHTLERLEFGKVLERLAARTRLALGAAAAQALRPTTDRGTIETRATRISEGMAALDQDLAFAVEPFEDPADLLARAAIEDAALPPADLQTVATILRNARDLQKTFHGARDEMPALRKLAADLAPEPALLASIEEAIEPDGTVADGASADLARIRRAMRSVQERIRQRLEKMVQGTDLKPFLTGDYVTLRNGRYVIPVQAPQAGQIPGIIHDRSDSGATVFVEPQMIVTLGNELRSLAADEQREVLKILRALTARVRGHLELLRATVEALVTFDLVRACGVYGRERRMTRPEVADSGPLVLVKARHPILEEALAERGGAVVPLDFELGGAVRSVAITGANAGGKTVALKTIGLVALMTQTGLPVPADEGTRVPLLRQVLVDIGDEQSIEANLSTFTGHMQHVREILASAGEATLVLLDEIGAGTDPTEGGALACAVLQSLHSKGAMTVVTTHLGQVKGFVHEQPGMENAAVEFDPETLAPTYRLILGQPGASHAIRIARRLGLPAEVLEAAEGLLDSGAIEMEGLLARLTAALKKAEAEAATAQRDRQTAEAAREELQKQLADLKHGRKEALRRAAEEARRLVENTRRQMDQALQEARQAGAKVEEARDLRQRVETKRKTLKQKSEELAPRPRRPIAPDRLEEGRRVWVGPMQCHGTITRVNRKRDKVTVEARGMAMEVEASALEEPQESAAEAPPEPAGQTILPRPSAVAPEVSLRGERYDAARRHLETYLHEAYLAGLGSVRIIHGHGTGALQQMVHEFLKEFPLVESFRFGERGEGGRGVTVAQFK